MKVAESASVANRIEQAFETASSVTGTSFEYLLKTAQRESALNESAKAETSSASGLFQFIESTWLETVKEAGHRHGLGRYSDKIERTASGHYKVSDPKLRREILDLRNDADIASKLAGELTQKNASYLREKLGREPSDGELYIAHFLGAGGASKLIRLAEGQPDLKANKIFAKQAAANTAIFRNSDGSARTVNEVYAALVTHHTTVGTRFDAPGRAQFTAVAEAVPLRKPGIAEPESPVLALQDPNSRVFAAWSAAAEVSAPFQSLFRTSGGVQAGSLSASFLSALAVQDTTDQLPFARLNPTVLFDGEADFDRQDSRPANRNAPLLQAAAASLANGQGEGGAAQPLNLLAYLTYRPHSEPKDVLPPI